MLHKKCLILGASRGLGLALKSKLVKVPLISVSRTGESDIKIDLSKERAVDDVLSLVIKEEIEVVYYVAGGGPHGDFFSKPWHSHEWAFKLNAMTPLGIIEKIPKKVEFVYLGSAIAERSESKDSLSYSWSKKLVKKAVLSSSNKNLLIFSPPYMDTGLLPKGAWPRLECPNLVLKADVVADALLSWMETRGPDERCFDWIKRFDYDLPKGFEL